MTDAIIPLVIPRKMAVNPFRACRILLTSGLRLALRSTAGSTVARNNLKTRNHLPDRGQLISGFTMAETWLFQPLSSFDPESVASVFFEDNGEDTVCQGSLLSHLIDRARKSDAPAAARGGFLIAECAIGLIVFSELFDSGDVDGHIFREDVELDLLFFDSWDLSGDDEAIGPLLQGHREGTPGILGGGEKLINALEHSFHRLFVEELIHGIHKISEAEWMFWLFIHLDSPFAMPFASSV